MSFETSASSAATRLGAELHARRRALGLRQAEVAELAGTTQRTVSVVENGQPGTRLETITAIAEALGLALVTIDHDRLQGHRAPGDAS